jgi:hypothetical protein
MHKLHEIMGNLKTTNILFSPGVLVRNKKTKNRNPIITILLLVVIFAGCSEPKFNENKFGDVSEAFDELHASVGSYFNNKFGGDFTNFTREDFKSMLKKEINGEMKKLDHTATSAPGYRSEYIILVEKAYDKLENSFAAIEGTKFTEYEKEYYDYLKKSKNLLKKFLSTIKKRENRGSKPDLFSVVTEETSVTLFATAYNEFIRAEMYKIEIME